jgi:hypothetical protein
MSVSPARRQDEATDLEKTRHWFIGTSNLQLVEKSMGAVAAVVGTLDFGLIHVFPRVFPSKNVVHVFAL